MVVAPDVAAVMSGLPDDVTLALGSIAETIVKADRVHISCWSRHFPVASGFGVGSQDRPETRQEP
jgi:hypothetical protein